MLPFAIILLISAAVICTNGQLISPPDELQNPGGRPRTPFFNIPPRIPPGNGEALLHLVHHGVIKACRVDQYGECQDKLLDLSREEQVRSCKGNYYAASTLGLIGWTCVSHGPVYIDIYGAERKRRCVKIKDDDIPVLLITRTDDLAVCGSLIAGKRIFSVNENKFLKN